MTTSRRKYLFGLIRISTYKSDNATQSRYMLIRVPILCIMHQKYAGWFRLFGKGLKWKNIKHAELTFGERNGFSKYIVINNWLISYLP